MAADNLWVHALSQGRTDKLTSMIKQLLLAVLWPMSKLKLANLYIWGGI